MNLRSHAPDYVFVLLVGILLVFGISTLTSVSSVVGFKDFGDSYELIKKQIFRGVIPGLILFFIFFKINYYQLKKGVLPLLIFSILLLVLVLIPSVGVSHGEARSWLGVGGITFQPAELAKLSFILYLSLWFSKRKNEEVKDFYKGLFPFMILLAIVTSLVLLQPDLGTAIVIILIALTMYILAGAKKTHLVLILLLGSLLFVGLMQVAKPYQKERLTTFLNPQYDIQGKGYHINQAFLAIGSGGLTGVGFGQSKQKFLYLPKVENDSIFAVIAEELGFIACFIFMGLISLIIYRGFQIAKNAPDNFSFFVVSGIISWFAIQTAVNIGAMVGLLPLTGVTLPFISAGGSSMMVFLAGFGIIFGITRYTRHSKV